MYRNKGEAFDEWFKQLFDRAGTSERKRLHRSKLYDVFGAGWDAALENHRGNPSPSASESGMMRA